MEQKIRLTRAVIVEGKYDKIKLSSVVDGTILVTNGFGIYKDAELKKLVRFYAERSGLIVMTDSDRAGRQIRAYIKSVLPKELLGRVAEVHIPQIEGKERRKNAPSKEGTLGVEGIDADILRGLLEKYAEEDGEPICALDPVTKNDMFLMGLSGRADSKKKRALLADALGLPSGLSSSALLDLLNALYNKEEIEKKVSEIT